MLAIALFAFLILDDTLVIAVHYCDTYKTELREVQLRCSMRCSSSLASMQHQLHCTILH